jgi:glycosyltransferase involved in cell wall biosynthesis
MHPMKKPKVALVHDYLVQYGGAEKTLEALCELFPDSPIYTGIYNPKNLSDQLNSKEIRLSKNSKNILMGKLPKHFTFLMPVVFEGFDLSEFDIVISDGTAWAKGVLTKPDQLHISYIHTPPRFLYKYSVESLKRFKWYYKPIVAYLENFLRTWDFSAAQRPDFLVTNSRHDKKRIRKFYRRDSTVIYPPVEVEFAAKSTKTTLDQDYYLAAGRLSAYKNVDLLVDAFNLLDMNLIVVGTGKEEKRLKRKAKSNIKFMGRVSEEKKHELFENCLGFLFPTVEEDFGIVPVEAMAHGKPVLAHKSGGVMETVIRNVTGNFFEEVNVQNFIKCLKEFDDDIRNSKYNAEEIKKHAQKYNKNRFKQEFKSFVDKKWEEFESHA